MNRTESMLIKLYIDNLVDIEQPSVEIACEACLKFLQAADEFDFTAGGEPIRSKLHWATFNKLPPRGQNLFLGLIFEKVSQWSQHEAQSLCLGSHEQRPESLSLTFMAL